MIELSPEDLKFKESAEFPGVQIRTNIIRAASDLETRKMEVYQDPKLVNLGTTGFLMAIFCGSLFPTKTNAEYREELGNFLSPYVLKRIVEFERYGRSDLTIADWLRRISRKIELCSTDIEIKKSLDAITKEQIEWAAKALENTARKRTFHGEDVTGNRRSAVGVLLDFVPVNGQLWDGVTAALSEKPSESIKMRRQSADKDKENHDIAIQELNLRLSEHIVRRIRYLDSSERFSFKEVAQWLRLFLGD
jgi:hypothetical protein